jgi:hypothetical protein
MDIADALVDGGISSSYSEAFMSLKVPSWLYNAGTEAPTFVKTVSFEVPDMTIEATVQPGSLVFHPGDPWVTGYAQVGTLDGFTMGYFEVIKWTKVPDMPSALSSQTYTTGLLPDANEPTLLYAVDPTKVPLPANWN